MRKNRQNSLVRWFEGQLFKLGWVNSPECDRCNQASGTATHILYDYEALAILRYKHLGCQSLKQDDSEDISVSKTLDIAQRAGLLNEWAHGLHRRSITVEMHGPLSARPSVFYSIPMWFDVVHFILFVRLNVCQYVCVVCVYTYNIHRHIYRVSQEERT